MSITVVTVAGPDDGPLLWRNAQLIHSKNPGVEISLYVIDNSRHAGGAPIEESPLWTVLDGISRNDPRLHAQSPESSQHGLALNHFISSIPIRTRYLIVLDPDFYIYYDNWIKEATDYMGSCGLAFFGAPWHPKWFTKYRNFPCVHCLFIDTQRVNLKDLDFTPDLKMSMAAGVKQSSIGGSLSKSVWAPILSLLYSMTLLRIDIGKAKDTGGKIYALARRKAVEWPSDMLVPCVRSTDYQTVRHMRYRIGRLIEVFMPERFSFVPKSRGYFTRKSSVCAEIEEEIAREGWEEFQWQARFFGVHMRRFVKNVPRQRFGAALLNKLDQIYGKPSLKE